MYADLLRNNEFFQGVLKEYSNNVNTLLDSLTGVLLRNHVMDYAKHLISKKIPFAFQIIDLDNFKLINDNYGHSMGDSILVSFAERLVNAVGESGLVGRYGGDEFLIVYPNIHEYNEVHKNVSPLFLPGGPLRNEYTIGNFTTFMTGTIGSSSFPDNATNFDDLFMKADKALYRGKQKGRNCFIIYVHEKHKDINVNARNKNALHAICDSIIKSIETSKGFDEALTAVKYSMEETLKISDFLYLPEDHEVSQAVNLLSNEFGVYTVTSLEVAQIDSMVCYEYMKPRGIQSLITYKINVNGINYGTLVLTETKIHRIWQDDDITMLMMIAGIIYYKFLKRI